MSIIIPTLNEEKALPELLFCIKEQTLKRDNFEVIIADAQSTDKTLQIAKEFGAKIVNGGTPAIGRNAGAKEAKSDILVFLDADVKFSSIFLEKALELFTNNNIDVACAFVKIKPSIVVSYFFSNMADNIIRFLRQFTNNPIGCGDFIMCKKNIFNKIGGFDEKMVFGEDIDFLKRAVQNKAKYRILQISYINSPRRIKKIGISIMMIAFILFGIASIIGIQKNQKVQKFIEKVYGKVGMVK
ncbi:MAG: glycosyltransferase [Candidatus Dojkabacteria bacterium]|nr:glycosyltransferase [Candidatus Dojkabacteria bacterium]